VGLLDVFAVFVLLVLAVAVIGVWAVLGMLPGRIARARNHPQAAAVAVCGWWGAITMGLLMPLAFIWAYYDPRWCEGEKADEASADPSGGGVA
jgi:uncharacterized BrkB/YihY/UPF0761 family membrane protein